MVLKRRRWPRVGELVIGTVVKIFDQGAYVVLDEYGRKEAYVPVSEITRSWFRDIREFLKEGQKAVFKVMRVDRRRGHIDVSLRRVGNNERRNKIREWKRAQRAEKLLELAAARLNKTLIDAYKEAGWKLEDYYGEIYSGLEAAVERGEDALAEAGLDESWVKVLTDIAKEHIELPKTKITYTLSLTCFKPRGIEAIKNALFKAQEFLSSHKDLEWRVYTIGAPRYRIEIVTRDPKEGEKLVKQACSIAVETIAHYGGKGTFQREGK